VKGVLELKARKGRFSPEVLELTIKTLVEHLHIIVESNQYTQEGIWRILASVSAQAGTVGMPPES
jgi:hypothetical protein